MRVCVTVSQGTLHPVTSLMASNHVVLLLHTSWHDVSCTEALVGHTTLEHTTKKTHHHTPEGTPP
jgi:anti-sigma factor ChrR (cupin superfamily)